VNVLERIVEITRADVAERRRALPQRDIERELARGPRAAPGPHGARGAFAGALARPGLALIAEHKRRSPSAGTLRAGATVTELVAAFERGGAAALSVLTERHHFGGSLDDLRAARAASGLPILRKDFLVDAYQLYEAAAAGADAVLLIVAALEPDELERLHRQARALGLDALVEVHDEAELDAALAAGAELIGINNRDLADFSVDVGRTFELLARMPAGKLVVSESGFSERAQLEALARAGVDAVLVGETLMRAPDPEAACRALTAT
jgi:indole-3-glycerol phosphate synthase